MLGRDDGQSLTYVILFGYLSSSFPPTPPCLDVNVRVSCLTLLGAMLSNQAPLPEVQLLLRQPGNHRGAGEGGGSEGTTPQEPLSWRNTPRRDCGPPSPGALMEGGSEGPPLEPCWLLQLCVSLVTLPREDPYKGSDSDKGTSSASLEPAPVRLEALQVRGRVEARY